MSDWPSTRAKLVLAALLRIGWTVERQTGSHSVLSRPGWPNLVFAFHDREESVRGCSPASPSTAGSRPQGL